MNATPSEKTQLQKRIEKRITLLENLARFARHAIRCHAIEPAINGLGIAMTTCNCGYDEAIRAFEE